MWSLILPTSSGSYVSRILILEVYGFTSYYQKGAQLFITKRKAYYFWILLSSVLSTLQMKSDHSGSRCFGCRVKKHINITRANEKQ
jgi:hypothetical protein